MEGAAPEPEIGGAEVRAARTRANGRAAERASAKASAPRLSAARTAGATRKQAGGAGAGDAPGPSGDGGGGGGGGPEPNSPSGGGNAAGLVPSGAFVRIKPLDVDRGGGAAATKQITGWDAEAGTVEMETGRSIKTFDYPTALLPPESTQEHVYNTVAAPLVAQFCDGTDVDLLSYGQTGAGKTYTMFGPPHSMAEAAAAQKKSGAGTGVSGDGILRPEHGFVLRSGLDTLAAVQALEARGCKVALHGAMIEMSILSFQDQRCTDLLRSDMPICFIDDENHLQGAEQMELKCAADVIHLAAAVEKRLTRGTKMNDTSSRSHCVAVLKLTVLEARNVRESRLQFFDLMGSERFVGQNSAHDTSQSSKATMGGWEGIYSNLSLMALYSSIELAAKQRKKKAKKPDKSMISFLLSRMLAGSLMGSALTGLITCVSQSPRNGEETYISLGYGKTMSVLLNKPERQPSRPIDKLLATARKKYAESAAVVARGVAGKYQEQRQAQVAAYSHTVSVLEGLVA
jgi:hypothetical protein